MTVKDLQGAFIDELRDIFSAEKQITKALRQMARKASSEDLRESFEEHLEQTERQIERLEQVFELAGQKPRAKHCAGMAGLIDEGKEILQEDADPEAKDAMLIAAAQKVEHYEIASYGTLCTWAEQLGMTDAKRLLGDNLDEEKKTDEKLTRLASAVNREAMGA
jgi:ferritin-like metal-binding protein YciE